MKSLRINKEELIKVLPTQTEVLQSHEMIKNRLNNLIQAMKLGNLYKQKARIILKTENEHLVEVEATIWNVSESHTQLKGGITIPNKSIIDVII